MNEPSTVGVLDEFQTELVDCWRRLPHKALFLLLLAAWLVLFQFFGNSTFGYVDTPSLFRWMLNSYLARDPDGALRDDSIGLWVPLVVLGLFWWKRKELMAVPVRNWWPGVVLTAMAMALHVAGYVIQQPKVSIVALFTGIYGLMGVAWGPTWLRRSFFPFFLLVFCVPFSSHIEFITIRLRMVAMWIVEWIAHSLLAIEVVREGTILRNPANQYQYEVAAACSGIRSLVTIGLFATVCAFVMFRSWWRRVALIASALPLAIAGNVLRLLTIIIAAEIWGQEAGSTVHEGGPFGIYSLLPYVPALVGLVAAGTYWSETDPESPPASA